MRIYLIFGVFIGGVIALALGLALTFSGSPAGPDEARREGEVQVYANVDGEAVAQLIAAFEARHTGVRVHFHDLTSDTLNARFLAEAKARKPGADIVWSSAMDMQAKLVNDGYALTYASPQSDALPEDAVWNAQSYKVTAEPVALAYNRDLIAPQDVPRTHAALETLLTSRRDELAGKLVMYDPASSSFGYLLLTQDIAATRDTHSLIDAIGRTRPRLMTTTRSMLDALAQGEAALAYNVVGPYAEQRAKADPRIGIVYPEDYTILTSRVAFIAREAPHPAAAKLFLDFLLSREGQQSLARAGLSPIRRDVSRVRLPAEQVRPIPGGPRLFVNLDPIKRARFLAQWNAALANQGPPE